MYTIGEVSQMFGIPVSTLRYYDKQGLFPALKRESGVRKFSDGDLRTLRLVECLKMSGLEIEQIRVFIEWCEEGPSTYGTRCDFFKERQRVVEEQLERLSQVLDMIRFKQWYYEQATIDGGEERLKAMLPDKLPPDVQRLYDHGLGKTQRDGA